MDVSKVIASVKAEKEEIISVFFVGCGASMAELYPAKYFLDANAEKLRSTIYTANEFNYATPVSVNEKSIVITCSLGGTTPETVEASKKAMELGAAVIAVTNDGDSPLAKNAHHVIVHGFKESYSKKMEKMSYVLCLAAEILNQYEGYAHYDAMMGSFDKVFELIDRSVESVLPAAQKFAQEYKDAPVTYLMSSGAASHVAYSFSICLLMEMQWMNSASFHDGEFFHGPFEIVEKDVPFILLMNDGKTRPMDSRALTFLQRFDAKVTLIDAKDFALGSVVDSAVVDYFNPILISAVLRVYAEQLALVRNHPLSKRRYMWKLDY